MSSPAPWNDARAKLGAAGLGVPIAWPNEPFSNPEPPALWVAVEMTGDVLAPIELASNGAWQEEGRLYAHVMTPAGWGSDQARALAKSIANVFRGLPPAPVVYYGASIGAGQVADPEGAWWRLTVVIDWRYQDVMT